MPKSKRQDGIYKRKDSPYWWVSFTNAGGKRTRRSTETTNRKEAEALLAKWKLEAHQAKHWDKQPDRTFDELMLAYLNETMHQKRTGERRIKVAAKRLYQAFSGCILNDMQPHDIRAYAQNRRGAGVSASTINKEIGLLSAAINYAGREWGWQLSNPVTGCRQREPEGRVRWITRNEAGKLIEAANKDPRAKHLPDFIRLALHTGCRKGELLGLEWSRVDLHANLIYLEAEHTKARRRRSVPLNKEARQAMISRAGFRAEHCPDSPWVFCNKDGERIQDVKRSFGTACKKAGITDFRIHDLRHTCAAWLVKEGVPLVEVRDVLGHQTIQMTERYAHLAPENVRAAVSRLENNESQFSHVDEKRRSIDQL